MPGSTPRRPGGGGSRTSPVPGSTPRRPGGGGRRRSPVPVSPGRRPGGGGGVNRTSPVPGSTPRRPGGGGSRRSPVPVSPARRGGRTSPVPGSTPRRPGGGGVNRTSPGPGSTPRRPGGGGNRTSPVPGSTPRRPWGGGRRRSPVPVSPARRGGRTSPVPGLDTTPTRRRRHRTSPEPGSTPRRPGGGGRRRSPVPVSPARRGGRTSPVPGSGPRRPGGGASGQPPADGGGADGGRAGRRSRGAGPGAGSSGAPWRPDDGCGTDGGRRRARRLVGTSVAARASLPACGGGPPAARLRAVAAESAAAPRGRSTRRRRATRRVGRPEVGPFLLGAAEVGEPAGLLVVAEVVAVRPAGAHAARPPVGRVAANDAPQRRQPSGHRTLGAVLARPVVLGRRRSRPAGTAASPHLAGRRAGIGSRCRDPAHAPPGSARRAGDAAPRRRGRPARRPWPRRAPWSPQFDFGAVARWITAWARLSCASGRPTYSTAWAAAVATEQRLRVGHADVLAGEDHDPAGDEPGVLAGHQHPGQPVQRRVRVGAAHALDERAGHVVVRVAVPVVADRRDVDRLLRGGEVDLGRRPGRAADAGGRLQRGQRLADVAAGEAYQMVLGLRGRA